MAADSRTRERLQRRAQAFGKVEADGLAGSVGTAGCDGPAGSGGTAEWQLRPISSAVERLPYKQDVAGSKPASGIARNHGQTGV